VIEGSLATTIHGRYLVIPPAGPNPEPVLAGFHGYAEDAETQLERLRAIPESQRWLCLSMQGLHRFYERRTNRVVACWMTRQDREAAIEDNIEWVTTCLKAVTAAWPATPSVVFAGFSQGVAMAFRAAVSATCNVAGVIAVGGDVPPELTPDALRRIPAVLVSRGANDALYSQEQFAEDQRRLNQSCGSVRAIEFDGGHEWPADLNGAASQFLRERC
jgi:predicted esterase